MRNREIGWTIAASAAILAATTLDVKAECGAHGPFAAKACGSPDYGEMGPGCCENPSPCCDDIWAGYCQERGACGWGFCWPAARVRTETRCVAPPDQNGAKCTAANGKTTVKTVVARKPAGRLATLPGVDGPR